MDKLRMQTANKADENFKKLATMFPNAVTETVNENGEVVRAIDKDVLMQEISCTVVDGTEERYQFTWPDKKKSVLLANAPINKTLRPVREDETVPTGADSEGKPYCSTGSVDFDTTENLYIEGDNLEVLKLLQETYLGKIKMIYIDPPYNTGNDFVYEDDFAQNMDEYLANSGQFDGEGNRLVLNPESNGRFHTEWLNMIYPRLKLAKDLLADDGVIFISIDDKEKANLKKICDEVLGPSNFVSNLVWQSTAGSNTGTDIVTVTEDILVYTKNRLVFNFDGMIASDSSYVLSDKFENERGKYALDKLDRRRVGSHYSDALNFGITMPDGSIRYPGGSATKSTEGWNYLWSETKVAWGIKNGFIEFKQSPKCDWNVYNKRYARVDNEGNIVERTTPFRNLITSDQCNTAQGTAEIRSLFEFRPFDFPKPSSLVKHLLGTSVRTNKEAIVLDFFSGSATTAHAVMQLNAEDGGHRKFIMVQLPEVTDEKSEAYKAGYKTICEIGKERIRRAGAKIKEEAGLAAQNLDTGFRVLKCDTSNMKDVYYNPSEYEVNMFSRLEDNIKEDRTPEDLLFQVMLDLGVLLSSKIEETTIAGKKVFNVEDNYLIACFDSDVSEETIKAIAKQKPYYFVMRDSSMASDSVATNFDQIFATYSPDTVRKVL